MKEYSAEKKGGDDSPTKAAETPVKAEPKANVGARGIKASGERGALTGSAWTFGNLRAPGGPADPKRAQQARSGPEAALTAAQVAGRRHLNAMVVAQLKASTGIDLSHVFVETDPQLTQQGKAGAAIGGKEIHVAPGHEEDTALLAHEAGHIVQQMPLSARGSAEQKGPDDEAGRAASGKPPGADNEAAPDGAGAGVEKGATDLEAEADAVATAVLSGQPVEVQGVGTGVLYEEEEPAAEASPAPIEGPHDVLYLLGPGQSLTHQELVAHLGELSNEDFEEIRNSLPTVPRRYLAVREGEEGWIALDDSVADGVRENPQFQKDAASFEEELDAQISEEAERRETLTHTEAQGAESAEHVAGQAEELSSGSEMAVAHNQRFQATAIREIRVLLGLESSTVVDEEFVEALSGPWKFDEDYPRRRTASDRPNPRHAAATEPTTWTASDRPNPNPAEPQASLAPTHSAPRARG